MQHTTNAQSHAVPHSFMPKTGSTVKSIRQKYNDKCSTIWPYDCQQLPLVRQTSPQWDSKLSCFSYNAKNSMLVPQFDIFAARWCQQ